MSNQCEQNGMATPADVPAPNNFNSLRWLTPISAAIGGNWVSGGLDDWVDESNPVRAVDVFVDALERQHERQ